MYFFKKSTQELMALAEGPSAVGTTNCLVRLRHPTPSRGRNKNPNPKRPSRLFDAVVELRSASSSSSPPVVDRCFDLLHFYLLPWISLPLVATSAAGSHWSSSQRASRPVRSLFFRFLLNKNQKINKWEKKYNNFGFQFRMRRQALRWRRHWIVSVAQWHHKNHLN